MALRLVSQRCCSNHFSTRPPSPSSRGRRALFHYQKPSIAFHFPDIKALSPWQRISMTPYLVWKPHLPPCPSPSQPRGALPSLLLVQAFMSWFMLFPQPGRPFPSNLYQLKFFLSFKAYITFYIHCKAFPHLSSKKGPSFLPSFKDPWCSALPSNALIPSKIPSICWFVSPLHWLMTSWEQKTYLVFESPLAWSPPTPSKHRKKRIPKGSRCW